MILQYMGEIVWINDIEGLMQLKWFYMQNVRNLFLEFSKRIIQKDVQSLKNGLWLLKKDKYKASNILL